MIFYDYKVKEVCVVCVCVWGGGGTKTCIALGNLEFALSALHRFE